MAATRKVNIAWAMLWHKPKRLMLSVCGIAFAALIMFMQLGFFNGINDSQAMYPTAWQADLVVLPKTNPHLSKWDRFQRTFLGEIQAQPGVAQALPLHFRNARMDDTVDGLPQRILVMAIPLNQGALDLGPDTAAVEQALLVSGTVAFDRNSRDIYGPVSVGEEIRVNDEPHRVAATYALGPNLSHDGTLVMGEGTWMKLTPWWEQDLVGYGLVRIEPGADLAEVRARIAAILPPGLMLMTPEELRAREVMHTIKAVPVGAIFGIGLIIGFAIGVVICYQILFNEITDHMAQFATMMAMGYGPKDVRKIVLQEAVLLSGLGFLVGAGAAFVLYVLMARETGLALRLSPERLGLILGCTVVMCIVAGYIAVRKALKLDPAELF